MSEYELIANIHKQAKALGACDLFTGHETIEEVVSLFLSPQGSEFCRKYHFPSTKTMREFKPYDIERYGVYIDAGDITLYNPERVALIGRTSATIYCTEMRLHRVFMYRGASAVINGEGWTVTRVHSERGCRIITNIKDNAIITQ